MSKLFHWTPDKGKKDKQEKKRSRLESPPEVDLGQASHSDTGEGLSEIDLGPDMAAILQDINNKLVKLDGIDSSVKSIDTRVQTIESTIKDLQVSVQDAIKSADEAKCQAQVNKEKCERLEQCVSDLKQENTRLNAKIDTVFERSLRIESQSRRNNLNLDGVTEEKDEKPESTLRIFRNLMETVGVPEYDNVHIERCHRRAGPRGKPRPIIVKFASYSGRQKVWGCREEFRKKNFWLREDFPKEYETRRAKLKPALKAAKSDPRYSAPGMAYLRVDQLVVDGKAYFHDNLDALPDGLKPHQIATRVADNFTLFYSKDSPFSNFHASPFTVNGENYTCAEQFFQAKKAQFFDDDLAHRKIMSSDEPHEHYKFGQQIKNFDEKRWRPGPATKCMEEALFAKFLQNPDLRRALIATQGTELVECSPSNKFWGIGLGLHHKYATEPSRWSGQNKLGTLLTHVRQQIMSDSGT